MHADQDEANPTSHVAIQPVDPAPSSSDRGKQKINAAFTFGLMLFLLVLVMAGVMFAIALRRRRAREEQLRDRARDKGKLARARPRKESEVDAWTEAGRRVEPLSAEELREAVYAEPAPEPGRSEVPAPQAGPERVKGLKKRPVAMITGAARRVGREIALEFAKAGCDVVFTYNASAKEAEELAQDLTRYDAVASFYRVDLSDTEALDAFAAGLADTLSRLDVLVHNASMFEPTPLGELTGDAALRQYRVNALAPLILTARFAPLLQNSLLPGGGCVIAMGDIHAMGRPRRDYAAYSMSKAALHEMIRTLARDLAPKVRVNGIAPGVVAWPEAGEESDPDAQRKYTKRIPLGRAGTPEDAAKVVRWLALEATYITGEIIRVDGGRWLT